MAKALLIVDMQKSFFETKPLSSRKAELVDACNRLIDAARSHGQPIIFARTVHQADRSTWTLNMLDDDKGFLLAGQGETDYLDGLKVSSAPEVIKTRDSAFWQTSLLDYLRQHNIGSIVLAGVSTHQCIAQTAVDGYNANLRVELAVEAIDTDRPAMHKLFLDILENEYRMPQQLIDDIDWRSTER